MTHGLNITILVYQPSQSGTLNYQERPAGTLGVPAFLSHCWKVGGEKRREEDVDPLGPSAYLTFSMQPHT